MNEKKYVLKKINETGLVKKNNEARFSINYENLLNPAQFEAVSSVNGHYLIIAGAGSGKTRTLTFRVARLIELGYEPNSILLLTFTRKAAKEMLNRAALLLDSRCSKIQGGTFHSFSNLILRKYHKYAGLNSSFTILDQSDSEDVINLIRSQSGFADKEKRFPNKQTLNKILSLSVNTGEKIENILLKNYPHFYSESDKIIQIGNAFNNYKRKNNLLDYDDLLVRLKEFLFAKNEGALSLLSSIKFIMVDEYQDTNKLQADIILGLSQINKNVMAVGDDSQSIYSFRGANFKNIIDFPVLFPGSKIIKLEENFRSTPEILNLANHIGSQALEKYEKNLFTKKINGELPSIIKARNENQQSKFICERILELHEEGIPLKEIAVLFRSSFFSFDLEIELTKANIPFMKFGGMKFIETAHIKDVLAFLRITVNPNDVVSWYRVLLLHQGVGPKTAQKVLDIVSGNGLILKGNESKFGKYSQKLLPLFELLNELINNKFSPKAKAEKVLEYYQPFFKDKYDDFHKRKKDLDILLNITENYRSLDSFLADMAIEPAIESAAELGEEDKQDEYVTLSTIHSAKGLEWNTVFIIHALDGFFPSTRSAESNELLEEERRLMYVAVTRAKQILHITMPMYMYERESGTILSKPSRFIADLNKETAENWLIEEEI